MCANSLDTPKACTRRRSDCMRDVATWRCESIPLLRRSSRVTEYEEADNMDLLTRLLSRFKDTRSTADLTTSTPPHRSYRNVGFPRHAPTQTRHTTMAIAWESSPLALVREAAWGRTWPEQRCASSRPSLFGISTSNLCQESF